MIDHETLQRHMHHNVYHVPLNAIAKARQFALLLMDLHGADHFDPFNAFEHEQDFYAQVADGTQWRIPRGKGEVLLRQMEEWGLDD